MKIKMEKSMNGATSALGNISMVYKEGQTYDMSADWQIAIAEAFISVGAAKEVSSSREKKVDTPTETQAETDAPKKKAKKK
tara:strand:- start:2597 stop:2839 length:243 start_codon:yes stop_codon:yes gene_type:complete